MTGGTHGGGTRQTMCGSSWPSSSRLATDRTTIASAVPHQLPRLARDRDQGARAGRVDASENGPFEVLLTELTILPRNGMRVDHALREAPAAAYVGCSGPGT